MWRFAHALRCTSQQKKKEWRNSVCQYRELLVLLLLPWRQFVYTLWYIVYGLVVALQYHQQLRRVMLLFSGKMLLVVLFSSLMLGGAAAAERVADDWVDPFDMLDYEYSTRRKESLEVRNDPPTHDNSWSRPDCCEFDFQTTPVSKYSNAPSQAREFCRQDSIRTEQHSREVAELQRQVG